MTAATHILQRAAQFQWDADSDPCEADNCRCTSTAMIAGFYRDQHFGPTYVRARMQDGSGRCGGTSAPEAVKALASLGIKAEWRWVTPAKVKAKLRDAIPVDIAVDYGMIPKERRYRTDFNFNGTHSVTACQTGTVDGADGIWVRDPDHGSPARPERPDKVFWPDSVWSPAFRALSSSREVGCATYPLGKKVIAAWICTMPLTTFTRYHVEGGAVVKTSRQFTRGWTNPCTAPGVYPWPGHTSVSLVMVTNKNSAYYGWYVKAEHAVRVR